MDVCVGDTIGFGAYGVVKKGKTKDNEYVAIKIEEEYLEDAGLIRECDVWANLPPHPNVMKGVMIMQDKSTNISVSPLVEGDIKNIADEMAMDPSFFKKVFFQICMGIRHMHQNGFVHSDLKTENVFYDSQGCIKLGDFGLTFRWLPGGEKVFSNTTWRDVGHRGDFFPTDASIDIFSLGIMFLEILLPGFIYSHRYGTMIWIHSGSTYSSTKWNHHPLMKTLKDIGDGMHDDWHNVIIPSGRISLRPSSKMGDHDLSLFRMVHTMLNEDPSNRPDIEEVINHEYFADVRPENLDDYILECGMNHDEISCTDMRFKKASIIEYDDYRLPPHIKDYLLDNSCDIISMMLKYWRHAGHSPITILPHLIWSIGRFVDLNGYFNNTVIIGLLPLIDRIMGSRAGAHMSQRFDMLIKMKGILLPHQRFVHHHLDYRNIRSDPVTDLKSYGNIKEFIVREYFCLVDRIFYTP